MNMLFNSFRTAGENHLKKSTYIWIGIFLLWLIVINSPLNPGPRESGFAYMLGEFVGAFIFICACAWVVSKVKGIIKKA